MNVLPEPFRQRMDQLLGDESSAFFHALTAQSASQGLRLNTLKATAEGISTLLDTELTSLPWCGTGFAINTDHLGKHPLHAAGLFYLQEPSAMAVAEIVAPQPGEQILDIAAAPGGKTTHLASLMENRGLLVANDPHGGRLQGLARNLERWGTRHTVITQETPQRLANHFGAIFDRVLVDAPCSGEGTFRKDPSEIKHWSPKAVERYAHQQNEILWFAAQMVKDGGQLVYSTCTFSPQENEGSVKRFLEARSDFEILPIPEKEGFSAGNPAWVNGPPSLRQTVRIWPHKAPGEGHFIASLRKITGVESPNLNADIPPELERGDRDIYQDFIAKTLKEKHLPDMATPDRQQLSRRGNHLYALPHSGVTFNGLRMMHWGWWLGTYQGGRFVPSHAFAMGLPGESFLDRISLSLEDQDVLRYLRGLPLDSSGKDGWLAVEVAGHTLGWGYRDQNAVQSHSPRWLSHI